LLLLTAANEVMGVLHCIVQALQEKGGIVRNGEREGTGKKRYKGEVLDRGRKRGREGRRREGGREGRREGGGERGREVCSYRKRA